MDCHGGGKPLVNPAGTQPRLAAWRADPPEQLADFEAETKAAGTVGWRLHLHGGAGHSFTNPGADARGMRGFFCHAATDRRSWNAMIELFNEVFGATE